MGRRILIVGIIAILIVPTIFFSFVSAEFWACFNKGEIIDFCPPRATDRTCGNSLCKFCMYSYNETANCYYTGNWNKCNFLPNECFSSGNTSIDSRPPIITVNNPRNNSVYNKRAVLLDLRVDEESDISYIDNNDDRGVWKRICQECLSYNRSRSFDDGLNNITIKAEDVLGNPSFFDVFFFVDSKKPIIKKIEPKNNAFANGNFIVTYYEENPEDVWLNYGNNVTGYRNTKLESCVGGKRASCEIDVNLADYDNEEIEYWFNITDIAGNSVKSRTGKVKVDITNPIINYFNYSINGRYVNFFLNITEQNFDSVEYIDNFASTPRWRTLCSRLKDGICEKKKSFSTGLHDLSIQITDEAGNSIAQSINFII